MEYAKTLIDKASKVCGSDKALAERMGIYAADISHLRAGKRPLSPELAAELADIAGEDAREAAIAAIIMRNENNRKGAVLREILGKALAAGVVGMSVFSYNGDLISATEKIANKLDSLYIVSSRLINWFRGVLMRCMGDCTGVHRALAFG